MWRFRHGRCRAAPAEAGREGRPPEGGGGREEEDRGLGGQPGRTHPDGGKGADCPLPYADEPVRSRHRQSPGRAPAAVRDARLRLVPGGCVLPGRQGLFYREVSEAELRSRLGALSETQEFVEVEPSRARRLIRDAAAYAAGLGLPAAKDTPVIDAIFGDVDANACTETFTFGKDGKPFYVSGPYDTPARVRTIGQALEKSCGTGNWDYMVEVPGSRISVHQ